MLDIALATEDELSEEVAIKLLAACDEPVEVVLKLRKNGSGYLRAQMASWRELARRQPILLLADLDQVACPAVLVKAWSGGEPLPRGLILRVAVREIESWLLADHDAMRTLLPANTRLPYETDDLPDPKAHLLSLAKKASRSVRDELLRSGTGTPRQGVGYNARLVDLVRSHWSVERAVQCSSSLNRSRNRLRSFLQELRRRPL